METPPASLLQEHAVYHSLTTSAQVVRSWACGSPTMGFVRQYLAVQPCAQPSIDDCDCRHQTHAPICSQPDTHSASGTLAPTQNVKANSVGIYNLC